MVIIGLSFSELVIQKTTSYRDITGTGPRSAILLGKQKDINQCEILKKKEKYFSINLGENKAPISTCPLPLEIFRSLKIPPHG